jgi:8-oxo-dGTP diphosphatase
VIARGGFNHHINAAIIFLDNRQRPTRGLQQRLQLRFNKPTLLIRIAHMAQRRAHVQRPARLALRQHIVATQMNLGRLARRSQLLQMTVAKLSLFIFLVANSLRICYPLGDWCGCDSRFLIDGRVSGCHCVVPSGKCELRFWPIVHDMLKNLIGSVWRLLPARVRRWSMRATHTRFTVTAGAVIFNDAGQVLLLKHRFRAGSGWGLPGGFLEAGEQPLAALKRELREEIGMEVESAEIFTVRSFRKPRQVEVLYLCRANSPAKPQTMEVESAAWFAVDSLPDGLPRDQRRLVEHAAQSE